MLLSPDGFPEMVSPSDRPSWAEFESPAISLPYHASLCCVMCPNDLPGAAYFEQKAKEWHQPETSMAGQAHEG
jgi:hypothetical protein